MKAPFGTLPLSEAPFLSRISTQYDNGKNYYLTGFNPGYALQASELNELQESFFLNSSLMHRSHASWVNQGYNIPVWDGCVPFDPTSIIVTVNSVGASTANFTVTIPNGWFLWTEKTSGLNFWVYNNLTDTEFSFTTTSGIGSTEYVGFMISNDTINCCQAGNCLENQDATLRDNSSGLTDTYYTCGASRKKATFDDAVILTSTTASDFYPLLKITIDTISSASFAFIDDQSITVG